MMSRIQVEEKLSDTDLMMLHENLVRHLSSPKHKKEEEPISLLESMNTLMKAEKKRKYNNILAYSNYYLQEEIPEPSTNKPCRGLCSSQCSLFQTSIASDVYICKTSGNIHYCTQASCTHLETAHDSKCCSITGLSYKLDSWVVLPTHNELCDYSNKEKLYETHSAIQKKITKEVREKNMKEGIIVRKLVKPKHPKRSELIQVIKSTSQALVVLKVKKAKLVCKKVVAPVKIEGLACIARKFICSLIPLLSGCEATRIASLCVQYWVQILQTAYYEKIKGRYKFIAHCAALVYKGMQGMKIGNVYVVEREPDLYKLLPSSKEIEKFGVKKNAYTTSSRHMKESLREIYLSKL